MYDVPGGLGLRRPALSHQSHYKDDCQVSLLAGLALAVVLRFGNAVTFFHDE